MSQLELDPQFTQGLRLLHSTNKDSAEQLRALLDEAIRQKHGPAKMLCNVLHKKYMMEEPVLSDNSCSSGKKSKSSGSSSKQSSKSSKNSSPVNLPARDTPPDVLAADDSLALEILEDDLTCVICRGMDVGARNRLVECVECHALYHQECHVPHIQDSQIDVPRLVWYCSNCTKTQQATVAVERAPAVKERSSPKTVIEGKAKESKKSSSSSSKHSEKYKSTSNNSSQLQSSNSTGVASPGSATGPKIMPNIHIVSADRRLKDMIKKAKQDKRTTNSGSGSTKHSSVNSTASTSSIKNSQEKALPYKAKQVVE
ncbi:integrator complex subunit 12 [Orussus abietinus]|uniref:integrator complex subunit 12 n=1 Tax=Orussus abietinus TaxID=222816 RepID=UPI0006263621|nr:integrator complex subunit 12 [Orussus abietinus]